MYNKITKRVENIHECSIISDVMFRDFEEEGGIGMIKRWRYVATAMLLCVMTIAASITSLAATKTISSVTIRVGTDIEAGDMLDDGIDVYSNSLEVRTGSYAATNSERYSIRDAEWVTSTSKHLTVGDEPKMRVYIYIDDDDYAFRGTYSSSNVKIKGGTFISAKRSSDELEVVVKLNGIKGTYPAPSDAGWKNSPLGKAVWNRDLDPDRDPYGKSITSGYYDVYLYRNGKSVKRFEALNTTTYNLYPYMTKEGTYSYKVRTVPYTEEQKRYGEKSEWTESDELYIDKNHVSDGTGQQDGNTGTTTQVGWIQSGNTWYYKYPDGSLQKDSWLKINNIWYLFDRDGKMLTGWQVKNGRTYYLQESGAMYTGWIKSGELWYFLNRPEDGDVEGAMRTGWLNYNGKVYYLHSSGAMAEGWTQIDKNWYYFYPGYGYKAVNTTIDTFYVDANGIWKK